MFISYSKENREIASKLKDSFNSDRIKFFIDIVDIQAGDSLLTKIGVGLKWCNIYVPLWSVPASQSPYVRIEWESAIHLKKCIMPCILDDTELDPILKRYVYIDLRDYAKGYPLLIDAIKAFCNKKDGN